MDSDDFEWRQIQQHYEFLRLAGTQGMAWFAFGCTINAAAAWVLLEKDKLNLTTNIVPLIVLACDVLAAIACAAMIGFYFHMHRQLGSMLMDVAPATVSDNPSRKPAFPVVLYCAVSLAMVVVYLSFSFGSIFGIYKGAFTI